MAITDLQRGYMECEGMSRELTKVHQSVEHFLNGTITEVLFTLEERAKIEDVATLVREKATHLHEEAEILLQASRMEKNNV